MAGGRDEGEELGEPLAEPLAEELEEGVREPLRLGEARRVPVLEAVRGEAVAVGVPVSAGGAPVREAVAVGVSAGGAPVREAVEDRDCDSDGVAACDWEGVAEAGGVLVRVHEGVAAMDLLREGVEEAVLVAEPPKVRVHTRRSRVRSLRDGGMISGWPCQSACVCKIACLKAQQTAAARRRTDSTSRGGFFYSLEVPRPSDFPGLELQSQKP